MFSFRHLVESMESSTSAPCSGINKCLQGQGTLGNDRNNQGWCRRVKKERDGSPGHTTTERDSSEGSESGMPAREKGGVMEGTEYGVTADRVTGGKGGMLEGTSTVFRMRVSEMSTIGADGVLLGRAHGTLLEESVGKETRKRDVNGKPSDIAKEESVDLSHISTPHADTLTWEHNHEKLEEGDAFITVKEESLDLTESSEDGYYTFFPQVCPPPPSTMSQVTTHLHNQHCHDDTKYRAVSQYHDSRTTHGMTLVPTHGEQRYMSRPKVIPTTPLFPATPTPARISTTLTEPFIGNFGHYKNWKRDARDHRSRYKHNVFLRDRYSSRREISNLLTEDNEVSNSLKHSTYRHDALSGSCVRHLRDGDGVSGSLRFTTDVPVNLRLRVSSGSSHTQSPSSYNMSSAYRLKPACDVENRRWGSVEQSGWDKVKGVSESGASLSSPSQHTQASGASQAQETSSSESTKNSDTSRIQDASLYRCGQCGAGWRDAASLARHQRLHSPARPYACSSCPSRFNQLVHLQIHLRTHTREKPFRCSSCTSSFNRKDRLRAHERTHSGEKPYPCPFCPAAYRDAASLRGHISTHIQHPPFICRLCHATFAHLATFTSHWRQTHCK